jgi:hypothetical protein
MASQVWQFPRDKQCELSGASQWWKRNVVIEEHWFHVELSMLVRCSAGGGATPAGASRCSCFVWSRLPSITM